MEQPPALPGDQFYLDAFYELSTTRAIGYSAGPIPWDKILSYADLAGLDEDLRADFQQIIRALDNAYINWLAEKSA